jgi:hypothetical protein
MSVWDGCDKNSIVFLRTHYYDELQTALEKGIKKADFQCVHAWSSLKTSVSEEAAAIFRLVSGLERGFRVFVRI